jgi:hypothetical protein
MLSEEGSIGYVGLGHLSSQRRIRLRKIVKVAILTVRSRPHPTTLIWLMLSMPPEGSYRGAYFCTMIAH